MRTSNSRTFWEIFIFQDFSMTAIFSRIFHDCGNPVRCMHAHRRQVHLILAIIPHLSGFQVRSRSPSYARSRFVQTPQASCRWIMGTHRLDHSGYVHNIGCGEGGGQRCFHKSFNLLPHFLWIYFIFTHTWELNGWCSSMFFFSGPSWHALASSLWAPLWMKVHSAKPAVSKCQWSAQWVCVWNYRLKPKPHLFMDLPSWQGHLVWLPLYRSHNSKSQHQALSFTQSF